MAPTALRITTITAITTMSITVIEQGMNNAGLLRLMQLVSPALPVGAYAYSQGQEYAVHRDWVKDEASAADWICGLLQHSLAQVDVPLLARLYRAWQTTDTADVAYWAQFLQASRESGELQREDRHLGQALARLLSDLGFDEAREWIDLPSAGFAVLFSLAAVRWGIGLREMAAGYLWAWCENQVAAAIKLVPLGQTAGQRLLGKAIELIPAVVAEGLSLDDEDIGATGPGLAIGSALHETQYSRLFRS